MLQKVFFGVAVLAILLVLYLAYGLLQIRFAPRLSPQTLAPRDPELTRRLRGHVIHLSGTVGTRSVYEPEKLEAANGYLTSHLRDIGYVPTFQDVPFEGRTYANVIVTLPGSGLPEETVLVGAHYDTVAGTPGADDNASAVAVLLELARALHGSAPQRTVTLVFFALEEPPVFPSPAMGSAVYAAAAKDRGDRIVAMLCLEMVGFFSERPGGQAFPLPGMGLLYPTTPNFLAIVGNLKSRGLARTVQQAFRVGSELPVEVLATLPFLPGVDLSDHRWFWQLGYEAVMLTDTAFYRNPNYHRRGDTADTLDYGRMAEVVRGVVRAVEDLAAIPLQPVTGWTPGVRPVRMPG